MLPNGNFPFTQPGLGSILFLTFINIGPDYGIKNSHFPTLPVRIKITRGKVPYPTKSGGRMKI
jgi:hypothetical protein